MKLEGKIIDFLGDSITEGIGVSDRAANRYDNVMLREYRLAAVHNYGIGGTRIAHQSVPSAEPRYDLCFCGRAYDISRSADIVVVFGGINDYIHGDAPVGSMGDTTPATFHGGVYFLMNYLKKEFKDKGKTVVFVSPAHCCFSDITDDKPSTRACKKPDAMPVVGYVDVIKETAKQFDIPVLDLYRNLPLDPNDPGIRQKYTSDGLHFNDAGHHILARTIGDFLLSL